MNDSSSFERIGWFLQQNLPLLSVVNVPRTAFADVYNLAGDGAIDSPE